MERGHDMTKSQKGTLCVFAAALLYSIGGLCIKLIPWGGMAINGSRTAIALVVIGAYLIWVKHPLRLNRWVALGAISVFGCNALFSIANKLTTAANTIVLQFTAPIFVLLITLLFFHRRPDKLDVITCVVVFGGVVFFFLDSLEMGGGLGNVLALAYILLTIGLKTTPPVTASLVSGIEPVLNPILVAVFYGEKMGPMALIGAAIVIGGVIVYNVCRAKKQKPEEIQANELI